MKYPIFKTPQAVFVMYDMTPVMAKNKIIRCVTCQESIPMSSNWIKMLNSVKIVVERQEMAHSIFLTKLYHIRR